MPLLTLPVGSIELFMLVYLRVLGMLVTLPVFGSNEVPRTIKAGLAAAFTLAVVGGLVEKSVPVPVAGLAFVLAAITELGFGLLCGWLVSWVIEAVIVGMQMVGFQMGFAIVNVVDPATGTAISLVASFQARVALIIFLAGGMYRPFMEAIANSFALVPPAAVVLRPAQAMAVTETMNLAFATAITLAGAPMVALLITKVGLGALARTVPQMNVFIVGFPLTIGVGLIVMAMVTPYFVNGVHGYFAQSLTRMVGFISTAAP